MNVVIKILSFILFFNITTSCEKNSWEQESSPNGIVVESNEGASLFIPDKLKDDVIAPSLKSAPEMATKNFCETLNLDADCEAASSSVMVTTPSKLKDDQVKDFQLTLPLLDLSNLKLAETERSLVVFYHIKLESGEYKLGFLTSASYTIKNKSIHFQLPGIGNYQAAYVKGKIEEEASTKVVESPSATPEGGYESNPITKIDDSQGGAGGGSGYAGGKGSEVPYNGYLPVPEIEGARSDDGTHKLFWKVGHESDEYFLYIGLNPGVARHSNYIRVKGGSHIHEKLAAGVTYYYAISVYRNNEEGPISSEIALTVPPAIVSDFSIEPIDETKVLLYGTAPFGTKNYDIYWSNTSEVSKKSEKIEDVSLPYTHEGLSSKLEYYYRVVAKNSGGESLISDVVSIEGPVVENSKDITIVDKSEDSVLISWESASAKATADDDLKYSIYYSTSHQFSSVSEVEQGTLSETYGGKVTTANISNLSSGKVYYINIVVEDNEGRKLAYNKARVIFPGTSNHFIVGLKSSTELLFDDPTPTLFVKGTQKGQLLQVFDDAACSSKVIEIEATGAKTEIDLPVHIDSGDYKYYAKAIDPISNEVVVMCSQDYATHKFRKKLKIEKIYENGDRAVAVLREDGSVVTWGHPDFGGDSSAVDLSSGVVEVVGNGNAFAALKSDGSVVTWGDQSNGGDSSGVDLNSGVTVVSKDALGGFLALKNENLVYWGDGDKITDFGVEEASISNSIHSIATNDGANVYLNTDGTLQIWGQSDFGGTGPKLRRIYGESNLDSDIRIALFDNGSVKSWVSGSLSNVNLVHEIIVSDILLDNSNDPSTSLFMDKQGRVTYNVDASLLMFNPVKIYDSLGYSQIAFGYRGGSLLHESGSIGNFGYYYDRNLPNVESFESGFSKICGDRIESTILLKSSESKAYYVEESTTTISDSVNTKLASGVIDVVCDYKTQYFAALFADGSVTVWKRSGVPVEYNANEDFNAIYLGESFIARKSDGSFVVGYDFSVTANYFNTLDDGSVIIRDLANKYYMIREEYVYNLGEDSRLASVLIDSGSKMFSNSNAWVVLKSDSSIIAGGDTNLGGSHNFTIDELKNVDSVSFTSKSFAALKKDGSVITWGDLTYGGNSSLVHDKLNNVLEILSNDESYVAIKKDGSLVSWGDKKYPTDGYSAFSYSNIEKVYSNKKAFAALSSDGQLFVWGNTTSGGDASTVDLSSNVISIYATNEAFSVIKDDGSVQSWGNPEKGGDITGKEASLSSGVVEVVSNDHSFAALKDGGSVIAWGDPNYGGDSSSVSSSLLSGVDKVVSTEGAFAALKDNGSVICWGHSDFGGDCSQYDLSQNVIEIYSTSSAFLAQKSDGSVVIWGDSQNGRDKPKTITGIATKILTTNNAFIFNTDDTSKPIMTWGKILYPRNTEFENLAVAKPSSFYDPDSLLNAYAALQLDGSVMTWGDLESGADSRTAELDQNIVDVVASQGSFAVIDNNMNLQSWGNSSYGGDLTGIDTSQVEAISANQYFITALKSDDSSISWGNNSGLGTNIKEIAQTASATALIQNDGGLTVFGNALYGGDDSGVSFTENIEKVIGVKGNSLENGAFAALMSNGAVVTWGDEAYGGNYSIAENVVDVVATSSAFAALKSDGSVDTWGESLVGGDSSSVSASLLGGVSKMCSTLTSFAALKTNGQVIIWGKSDAGGGTRIEQAKDIQCTDFAVGALLENGAVVTAGKVITGSLDISQRLSSNVVYLDANKLGFLALKDQGQIVVWGSKGLNDSYMRFQDYLKDASILGISKKDYFWKVNSNSQAYDLGLPSYQFGDQYQIRLEK